MSAGGWTAAQADRHLDGLEGVGWRFGTDRMRALCAALGDPQRRFRSVHVVGTNGKSSVARIGERVLAAHGLRSGAYLSPHLRSWADRVIVDGEPLDDVAHARSVARTAEAARAVERELGEPAAQFEVATASAFLALADLGVEAAFVEAGLGGRLDATNVLDAPVVAVTSIGLDHTEWLGGDEASIAREKLAVVPAGATVVHGPLPAPALEEVRRVRAEQGASVVEAPDAEGLGGGFRATNAGVAIAACRALLGEVDEGPARDAAARAPLPGRLEVRRGQPDEIWDGAHNPPAAEALAHALPAVLEGREAVACVSILEGRDAGAILVPLAPLLSGLVATEVAGTHGAGRRAMPAPLLAGAATEAGIGRVESVVPAAAALERARRLAREGDGVTLVCGSLYLLSELWNATPARSSSR